MTPRQAFGVAVRIIGLLSLLGGLYSLGISFSYDIDPTVWGTLVPILVGAYLLRGAPLLVAWAYAPRGFSKRHMRRMSRSSTRLGGAQPRR